MEIGLPQGQDQLITGMRKSCDIVIEINMTKASILEEILFWTSNNNVILSKGAGQEGCIRPIHFRSLYGVKDKIYYY